MPEDKDFKRGEKETLETAFKQPARDVDIYRDTFIRYMGEF